MTESDDLLATGQATQTQLAKLFRRDKNIMPRLLNGVPPVGTRKGYPVYSIAEAAAMLVPIGYDVEERLRHLNQADLPPLLGKEFWNGQAARLKFEREQGDSWATPDVVAALSSAASEIKMVLLLMLDRVEQETTLSNRQRDIIKRHTDGGIAALKKALVDAFADYEAPVDNIAGVIPETDDL